MDIRKMKVVIGRSINMAMSTRGREALKRIGAEERITSLG
jgi:kynurenine 3-monooxygenase